MARDIGRERFNTYLRRYGTIYLNIPASGGGIPGMHRPDIIIFWGPEHRTRIVAEVKSVRSLPLYLKLPQVKALLYWSHLLDATPFFAVNLHRHGWRMVKPSMLVKVSTTSRKIDESTWNASSRPEWVMRDMEG